ncbi:MAG: BamA/OMP85 family outer membrane protein [Chthoniobacterales bacterium]
MKRALFTFLFSGCALAIAAAQSAVSVPRPAQKDKAERAVARQQEKKAQRSSVIEFRGQSAFKETELRSQLKDQIATIGEYGLTAARGDDVAFFLALFYRKHGYSKVNVRYTIESGDRLRLDINEGPLVTLGLVNFVGNRAQPSEKLFEYAVGPTRERYSKMQKQLPFVAADVEEGADLVHRLYIAEGFLDAKLDPPVYHYSTDAARVDVTIPITEGRQYFFGNVTFAGQTIYGAEALRGQMLDLLEQPYTDNRVADVPRRMQTYFRTRGYYGVKVDAVGNPLAAPNGRVPVRISIVPGPLYHFDGVTVKGVERLRPSYITRRFSKFSGKTYSPEVVDERFRELMRTGLFNVLQIKPTPIGGNALRLDISAEEAKSKEFGFSLGYGSYAGAIVGAQYSDRDLFGYGRPLSMSAEYSQRGYKGEILWQDPYFLDTEFRLKAKLSALTFDFDGYSKFEFGGRIDFTRKLSKYYEVGLVFSARRVNLTTVDIDRELVGDTKYFVTSIGLTQTLDLRDSKFIPSRGFVFDNTFDLATGALGSQIDFVRSTARLTYFIPFASKTSAATSISTTGHAQERSWFQRSSLALGARVGIIRPLGDSGPGSAIALPIDERFFNGGSSTVRSFTERDLGPHDRHGYPIGGNFFTVFNAEYTFPIWGEIEGAVFVDAGNLLPSSEDAFASVDAGIKDMRYAVGAGLRYKLPIGPVRIDYGVNPNPREGEDIGAFHFSFGFAF